MADRGRSFGNRAVSRPAPTTIDAYLAGVAPRSRAVLRRVRRTIRVAAPDATESISYGIPIFKQDGQRLIYFSAATKHSAIHMVRRAQLAEIKVSTL